MAGTALQPEKAIEQLTQPAEKMINFLGAPGRGNDLPVRINSKVAIQGWVGVSGTQNAGG